MNTNKRLYLILSIVQFAIGFLISLSFVVLAVNGYDVKQYISRFVVGLLFVVLGIFGIVKWFKSNK